MSEMNCPLCGDGDMIYEKIDNPKAIGSDENGNPTTHAWVCNVCPAILMEWYDNQDTKVIAERLGGLPKEESVLNEGEIEHDYKEMWLALKDELELHYEWHWEGPESDPRGAEAVFAIQSTMTKLEKGWL